MSNVSNKPDNQSYIDMIELIIKNRNISTIKDQIKLFAETNNHVLVLKALNNKIKRDICPVYGDEEFAPRKFFAHAISLMIISKGDISYENYKLLRFAARNNNYQVVELMINYKADISVDNNYPLRTASSRGYFDIVKLLIKNKANPVFEYFFGNPFSLACHSGHLSIIKYFEEKGFKASNDDFCRACLSGQLDVVKYLYDRVEITDDNLLNAVNARGQTKVAKYLIEKRTEELNN